MKMKTYICRRCKDKINPYMGIWQVMSSDKTVSYDSCERCRNIWDRMCKDAMQDWMDSFIEVKPKDIHELD